MTTGIIEQGSKVICLLLTTALLMLGLLSAEVGAITLASGGSTAYSIVSDIGSDAEVDLAVGELKDHIEQSTGATFPSVDVSAAGGLSYRIIVGDNTLSRSIIGSGVIDALGVEETLVKVSGDDLVIVGGEPRGTLYAVYSFLENEVGCRWYVDYLGAVIPQNSTLTVGAVDRSEIPDYSYSWGDFNRFDDPQVSSLCAMRNRGDEGQIASGLDPSEKQIGAPIHTLFYYIPPHDYNPAWAHLYNPPEKNFFVSHPEYFSLVNGSRTDNRQLEFGNAGLRAKLTEQIELVIINSLDYVGQKAFFGLSTMDTGGGFSQDPASMALVASYGCPGGPFYDYVLNDLSPFLATNYPNITVEILAYRKDMTEIPPAGVTFPDNVRVLFAPIGEGGGGNDFAQPFNSPTNQDTLSNMTGWCAASDNVRVWYYPNPFISAGPPFSSIDKIITDIPLMHQLGVTGFTTQQSTPTTDKVRSLNFADFDNWLMRRLTIDSGQDTNALKAEFLDYYFGAAASLMATYIAELEAAQDTMVTTLAWNATMPDFTYVTPQRLVDWQDDFDDMEAAAASSPVHLQHVRTARITLDTAMLTKWSEVIAAYPSLSRTPRELYVRIIDSATTEMESRCFPAYQSLWWGPFRDKIDAMYLALRATESELPEPYLYWSFDVLPTVGSGTWPDAIDATPFVAPFDANALDVNGNGREGVVSNTQYTATTTVPITLVDAPIVGHMKAIHFGADGTIQQVKRVDAALPAFSNGISMRGIWQLDEAAPADSRYEMMQLGSSGTANDALLLTYDNHSTECLMAFTKAGGTSRSVTVLRSDIELAIGHSIIAEPTVFAVTYDNMEIALYADGTKVGSYEPNVPIPVTDFGSTFCIGNDAGATNAGSRKATFDEFKVWDFALTAEQAAQDYGEIIGGDAGACAAAWALGNGIPGDLNRDCSVGVEDMAIFVSEWLLCTPGADVSCP